MSEHKPHSELPPVSYEALEANNRHTHANLNACIEQRQRLEEQLESYRAALEEIDRYAMRFDGGGAVGAGRLARAALASNPASERQ